MIFAPVEAPTNQRMLIPSNADRIGSHVVAEPSNYSLEEKQTNKPRVNTTTRSIRGNRS